MFHGRGRVISFSNTQIARLYFFKSPFVDCIHSSQLSICKESKPILRSRWWTSIFALFFGVWKVTHLKLPMDQAIASKYKREDSIETAKNGILTRILLGAIQSLECPFNRLLFSMTKMSFITYYWLSSGSRRLKRTANWSTTFTMCPIPRSCKSSTCMHRATGYDSISGVFGSCPCIHNAWAPMLPFHNIQRNSQLNNQGMKANVQNFSTHACISAIINMHMHKSFNARR